MFSLYSERARQVIFLARLESGARGAEVIDFDDLIAALIVEDQNQIPDALGMKCPRLQCQSQCESSIDFWFQRG